MAKDGPSWYYKKKILVHRNTFWTRKLGLKRKKKKWHANELLWGDYT